MDEYQKIYARRTKMKLLKDKLPYFAKTSLKIRDKSGEIKPFVLNKAQEFVHQRLEEQKRTLGFVRALILKGRQQGCSTYVAARFYHKTIFNPESSTFILSHQAKTTGPLFDMVKRYHDNMPGVLAPTLDTSNKNQMKFAFPSPAGDNKLISEYTVGTAGNEDIGRGFTIKYLHCSEAAFYDKTDELETGLFQAVAELPGTEIIMESTANGIGNMFYRKAMDAIAGKGIYQLIFVPWFWQAEYRAPFVPENFVLEQDEAKLKELYDLEDAQILWRRNKIVSLGTTWKFQQEYPMNATEAFVVSGVSLIDKEKLMEARKCTLVDTNAPVVFGVDCARSNDRTVVTIRRGRQIVAYHVLENTPGDTGEKSVELANFLELLIKKHDPQKVFIDYAQGYGTIDLLRSWGYREVVQGIYFNQKPAEPDLYLNKRAEMCIAARDWVHDGNVNIPDADDFFTECALIPEYKETPTKKKYMPPKSEIKLKLGGLSTDIWDSFILTFAFVLKYDNVVRRSSGSSNIKKKPSPYQTAQRINQTQQRGASKTIQVDFSQGGG